jgi:hypothetical protein
MSIPPSGPRLRAIPAVGLSPLISPSISLIVSNDPPALSCLTEPCFAGGAPATLVIYSPSSITLLDEAGAITANGHVANEAGLRRKEADYRAELVRVQGTISYNVQAHKILETEHRKVLGELESLAPVAEQT